MKTALFLSIALLFASCAKDSQTKPDAPYFPSTIDRADYLLTIDCKTCTVTQNRDIEYTPTGKPQKIQSQGDDSFHVTSTTNDTVSVMVTKDLKYINIKFRGIVKPNYVYRID